MAKTKSTKRALLLSALSLTMCVSLLVGSTFAWFTDSVVSGNNKIVAGFIGFIKCKVVISTFCFIAIDYFGSKLFQVVVTVNIWLIVSDFKHTAVIRHCHSIKS